MAEFVGQTFENIDIHLDGNTYQACNFITCNLIFAGVAAPSFDRCVFDRCRHSVEKHAALTIGWLSAIYHNLGEGGQQQVETLFNQIRAKPMMPVVN